MDIKETSLSDLFNIHTHIYTQILSFLKIKSSSILFDAHTFAPIFCKSHLKWDFKKKIWTSLHHFLLELLTLLLTLGQHTTARTPVLKVAETPAISHWFWLFPCHQFNMTAALIQATLPKETPSSLDIKPIPIRFNSIFPYILFSKSEECLSLILFPRHDAKNISGCVYKR